MEVDAQNLSHPIEVPVATDHVVIGSGNADSFLPESLHARVVYEEEDDIVESYTVLLHEVSRWRGSRARNPGGSLAFTPQNRGTAGCGVGWRAVVS